MMEFLLGILMSLIAAIVYDGKRIFERLKVFFENFRKDKQFWISTKKLSDGDIAPFVFLSIEIIRKKDYFHQPIKGAMKSKYDNNITSFQIWIEKQIPFFKQEYKWYWTGHQGLYGFYDNNKSYGITSKVVDIGKNMLASLNKFSKNENPINFRIIIHYSQNDIRFRKDINKRTGIALDFLYEISIPSKETNLFITNDVFAEIEKSNQTEFVKCQFKALGNELYSLKTSTKQSLQKFTDDHLRRGEVIFAADFSNQILAVDKHNIKRNIEVREKLKSIKNQIFPISTLVFLYNSQFNKSSNLPINNQQFKILKEYEKIEKAIEFCINQLENGWYFEYVLLAGKSPKNYRIDSILQEKVIKNDSISIHNDCCLCTAKYGITNLLINNTEKAKVILDWLKKQKPFQYRSQDSRIRDWRYTARVLRFAIMMDDEKFCNELFELILKGENWLENSEWNSIRVRGLIIAELCNYIEHFSVDVSNLRADIKDKLKSEIINLINDIDRIELSPIVLDGLIGLICTIKIGINRTLNLRHDIKKRVEKYMAYMMNNSLWNEDTGAWGYENPRTFYRIRVWYEYWEYKLKSQ